MLKYLAFGLAGALAGSASFGSSSGTGNPGYTFCLLQGGQVHGLFCQIGAARIEPFTLLRSLQSKNVERAVEVYLNNAALVDPAKTPEQNCTALGGQVHASEQGCELAGNSNIGLETLQSGAEAPANKPMTHVVKRQIARYQPAPEVVALEDQACATVGSILAAHRTPDFFGSYDIPRIDCTEGFYPRTPTTCSVQVGNLCAPIQIGDDDGKTLAAALASKLGSYPQGVGSQMVTGFDLHYDAAAAAYAATCSVVAVDLFTGGRN